jgi:hypothetical protein
MSTEHLGRERLNLDLEHFQRRVQFLVAYAATCDADASALSHQDAGDQRSIEHAIWAAQTDAASSIAEAAQLATVYAPDLAVQLFDNAGERFFSLGYAYGLFLRATAGQWDDAEHIEDFERGIGWCETLGGRGSGGTSPIRIPSPWHAPQQQAYFVLAVAGSPAVVRYLGERTAQFAADSPHHRGVVAMGALGTGLHRFWDAALQIIRVAGSPTDGPAESIRAIVEDLTTMIPAYEERMTLARANTYLWSNLASPVNVADIEIVAITAMATRAAPGPMQEALRTRLNQMSPLARVPVELGMELALTTSRRGPHGDNLEEVEDFVDEVGDDTDEHHTLGADAI